MLKCAVSRIIIKYKCGAITPKTIRAKMWQLKNEKMINYVIVLVEVRKIELRMSADLARI